MSLSEYVERFLIAFGAPRDAACYLEDAIRDRLYLTRENAQAAAGRMELWSVNLRLQGHDLPVLAADAVHRGHGRWGVEVDYLGAFGWMSEREQAWNDEDDEQWKDDQP